ncbi:MAG TPA: lanthionine synthetase C family protein [Thermoanaerobaculia bacterium]|nr:lanthionine synthetase C family protein [Thermoanaerobaculia bacterium]
MSLPWRPLLAGEAAARALAAAGDIAAVTARGVSFYPRNLRPEGVPVWENALSSGRVGQCLLHAYLALHGAGAGDAHADVAIDLLDQATEAAAGLRLGTSLYLGFPGIAWTAAHLAGRLFADEEDGNREVDEVLLRSLSRSPWEGAYDLFTGLVGLGVYALERLPRPAAAQCLEAVVAQLARRAERHPEGAAFFSPVGDLPPQFRGELPQGAYVLGMGQGVAGVIALLGAACQAGVAAPAARSLLAATVSWLLARERPPESGYRFPQFHFSGAAARESPLAWRVGDLGIAASLLLAARGAGEPAWEAAGRRVALAAAARHPDLAGGAGAGLSDGPAGIGHVFNRLYQATGETALAEAARRWLDQALAQRTPGVGIAGFRITYRGEWLDEPGFARGATGIGLALLAAVSQVDPAWDRALLLSTLPIPLS